MTDVRCFQLGRLKVGVFQYWIGFSWRRVGGFGRVLSWSLGAGSDEDIVLFNMEVKGTRPLIATSHTS